jgi:hypothetical protein
MREVECNGIDRRGETAYKIRPLCTVRKLKVEIVRTSFHLLRLNIHANYTSMKKQTLEEKEACKALIYEPIYGKD